MPQFISQAINQFQQAYQSSGNPIFAGVQVSRSMYDNRDRSWTKAVRGIGGFTKEIWSKFWDNKEEIMGGVIDMLQKKPRLRND